MRIRRFVRNVLAVERVDNLRELTVGDALHARIRRSNPPLHPLRHFTAYVHRRCAGYELRARQVAPAKRGWWGSAERCAPSQSRMA